MVVVEGVARKLDPHLNMWATAEPVVGGWIADNLGPRGRLEEAGQLLRHYGRALAEIPSRVQQVGRVLDKIDKDAPPTRVSTVWPLWLIVVILIWIAVRMSLR
jgi:ubiquinone biosynthesis protein